ncbi:MAG: aminotransferase class IV [Deltaproteobacteria bacterium]|nr:aminotransferase class IV [Deltaproteobacteria bacterium]
MLEERVVYLNGTFVPWNEAKTHMMCHSFGRGAAIFEVLSVHEVDGGASLFRLDQHVARLYRTAELLGMRLSQEPGEIHEACLESVRRNGVTRGFVKVICFHSGIAFEILPPDVPLDVSVFVVDPAADLGGLKFPFDRGASACFSRWRKLDPQCVPVEAKAAANYLNGMMARAEARSRGYDNVIMLDTQGFVAEGGTESVFMVENGVLMTPCAGTVLLSITRQSLLQMAEVLGLEAREARIQPDRLLKADELLFSGTPNKVLPVRRLEDRDIEGTPGPVTRKLFDLMNGITSGRDHRFREWLFPV